VGQAERIEQAAPAITGWRLLRVRSSPAVTEPRDICERCFVSATGLNTPGTAGKETLPKGPGTPLFFTLSAQQRRQRRLEDAPHAGSILRCAAVLKNK